jgi:hypothetical protein
MHDRVRTAKPQRLLGDCIDVIRQFAVAPPKIGQVEAENLSTAHL